jgi:zinc transporter ZupT
MMLAFSGAYLFSITIIHILPELLQSTKNFRLAGVYVLCGFIFQMILEYFTTGVEHGHINIHIHPHPSHHTLSYSMLLALCLHSFLDGTLLVHPFHTHQHNETSTLLFGLIIHKVPEALAFASVLRSQHNNKILFSIIILIYSLCSPAGLLLNNTLHESNIISESFIHFLFAIIAGNFLYISTTIFFEASPDHTFKANKLIMVLLGAALAAAAEFLFNN